MTQKTTISENNNHLNIEIDNPNSSGFLGNPLKQKLQSINSKKEHFQQKMNTQKKHSNRNRR